MKYQRTIIWCIGLMILLACCSSPQKSFDKGNYDKAYAQALKNLQKGSKDRKDRNVLNSSFERILIDKQELIASYSTSDIIEDWEEALVAYDDIIEYGDGGRSYLSDNLDDQVQMLKSERDQLKYDIAENYYQLANDAFAAYEDNADKLDAQDAYTFYDKSLQYGSEHSDIDSKMDQAYEWAKIKVYVEAKQSFGFSYDWDIDREFSQVERRSKGFAEVSYEKNKYDADCILEISISDDINVRESTSTDRFSEEIEDGYDTKVDTSGNTIRIPRTITVTGRVQTITQVITFECDARVLASGDSRICNYSNRSFDAEERVTYERYEWDGDERAIPDRYKRSSRNDPPDEEEIIEDLLEELYDDFVRYYF